MLCKQYIFWSSWLSPTSALIFIRYFIRYFSRAAFWGFLRTELRPRNVHAACTYQRIAYTFSVETWWLFFICAIVEHFDRFVRGWSLKTSNHAILSACLIGAKFMTYTYIFYVERPQPDLISNVNVYITISSQRTKTKKKCLSVFMARCTYFCA